MVEARRVRRDVEGDLVVIDDGRIHAKALSQEVAWHLDDPEELADLLEDRVEAVQLDTDAGVTYIRYPSGTEPLDLERLRALIDAAAPMAAWRLARLGRQLAASLGELHGAGVPQMLLHPERVAIVDGVVGILPTLASVLPPLPDLPPNEVAGWLHYVAPEVIRTRAVDPAIGPAADVFSLGRLLHALAVGGFVPALSTDPLTLAEELVEGDRPPSLGDWPDGFGALEALVHTMVEALPEDRPTLEEVVSALGAIAEVESPAARVRALVDAGDVDGARRALDELEELPEGSRPPGGALHRLRAELALVESPPDLHGAVVHLKKALQVAPDDLDARRLLGLTYARDEGRVQHLELAAEELGPVAGQTGADEDVEAWLDVISRIPDPEIRLRLAPRDLIGDRRFARIRLRAHLDAGDPLSGWGDAVLALEVNGPDDDLLALAREIAGQRDPLELMTWKYANKERRGIDAALAIVWERNGNVVEAEKCLEAARQRGAGD